MNMVFKLEYLSKYIDILYQMIEIIEEWWGVVSIIYELLM